MRWLVIGSGAIGTFFGARLQLAGHETCFLARGARLAHLRRHGVVLRTGDTEHALTAHAIADIAEAPPPDIILMCTKTWQLPEVLPALARHVQRPVGVVTFQNGVEAPAIVRDQLPGAGVLGGTARGFFELDPDGTVRHRGVTPFLTFGAIDDAGRAYVAPVRDAISRAGIACQARDDIAVVLWEKFLLVSSIGAVASFHDLTIGHLTNVPDAWAMLGNVMREIAGLADKMDIGLPHGFVDATMAFVSTFPDDATTSMQRDIKAGQPSEIDSQIGAVVRMAADAGIDVPASRFLYEALTRG